MEVEAGTGNMNGRIKEAGTMQKKKNLKYLILLTVLLTALAAARPVLAYFTGSVLAEGGRPVRIRTTDTPHEDFSDKDWIKRLTVKNTGSVEDGDAAIFVRARAFAGETFPLHYSGSGWTDGGDGWWYFDTPVEPGRTTTEFCVEITGIPEDDAEAQDFNVAVVYESTPALYRSDGTAYADFSRILDTGSSEGAQE